jgi:predicted Zn-dependent protease
VSWNRREVLGSLGVASAQALLWACGGRAAPVRHAPTEVSGEIRSWLRDAVATLRSQFTFAHALAVSRRRTTGAIDVLGAGVSRGRYDSVVLTVRDKDGARREQVTSDLSQAGVAAAVHGLIGTSVRPAKLDFGAPWTATRTIAKGDPRTFDDVNLLDRVATLARRDHELSSRIVYAATLIDIDDADVWSVAPGHDLEQRLVRVRRVMTRVAWNGTRPVVSEVARAWTGGVDVQDLSDDDIAEVTRGALVMMTPTSFDDGVKKLVLAPTVAATVIDAAARGLLTSAAIRRPEVARRLAVGASVASPVLTLVDDPTAAASYGGFDFDDEGEPAALVTLLDGGHVVGRLADADAVDAKLAIAAGRGRRPGHVGPVEPAPSHLRLVAGGTAADDLISDGFVLQGGLGAVVDPASDRIVIAVARAEERRAGKPTGRVFADLELVGDLAKLLASVTSVSKETATLGVRDEIDGQPRWRSIESPSLAVEGLVRARRRPA